MSAKRLQPALPLLMAAIPGTGDQLKSPGRPHSTVFCLVGAARRKFLINHFELFGLQ
jgi:hypothetical protein